MRRKTTRQEHGWRGKQNARIVAFGALAQERLRLSAFGKKPLPVIRALFSIPAQDSAFCPVSMPIRYTILSAGDGVWKLFFNENKVLRVIFGALAWVWPEWHALCYCA
ncbi:MAG: hypothetical protein LBL69_03585 [Zoogloeaceae bacterium]|nr:hypothetical protein [Zoogloeaceae bacterium]